jgi:hypothetical protein
LPECLSEINARFLLKAMSARESPAFSIRHQLPAVEIEAADQRGVFVELEPKMRAPGMLGSRLGVRKEMA